MWKCIDGRRGAAHDGPRGQARTEEAVRDGGLRPPLVPAPQGGRRGPRGVLARPADVEDPGHPRTPRGAPREGGLPQGDRRPRPRGPRDPPLRRPPPPPLTPPSPPWNRFQ